MDELEKKLEKQWAHPALVQIWMITQTPDYEDGEAILHEYDIEEIGRLILEANEALNVPEVKVILQTASQAEPLPFTDGPEGCG